MNHSECHYIQKGDNFAILPKFLQWLIQEVKIESRQPSEQPQAWLASDKVSVYDSTIRNRQCKMVLKGKVQS